MLGRRDTLLSPILLEEKPTNGMTRKNEEPAVRNKCFPFLHNPKKRIKSRQLAFGGAGKSARQPKLRSKENGGVFDMRAIYKTSRVASRVWLISSDIKGIANSFRDCESELQCHNCRSNPKSMDDSPRFIQRKMTLVITVDNL